MLSTVGKLLLWTIFAVFFITAECANILFFIGFGGPSHRIAMEPLAQALLAKNHHVTFLVMDEPHLTSASNHPNLTYFVSKQVTQFLDSLKEAEEDPVDQYTMRKQGNSWKSRLLVSWYGVQICEALYKDDIFMADIINGTKFDLVIIDALFNECGYAIAHLHQAKVIVFVVSSIPAWLMDGLGFPDESASFPVWGFTDKMAFHERLASAILPIIWRFYREWHHFPQLERVTREGLERFSSNSSRMPSFKEMESQVDLVLLNTHPAQEYPRSLPPNVITVGGISWSEKERHPLPQKLQEFLVRNEWPQEGFVYVNFGSFLDFSMLPADLQQVFIRALGSFSNMKFVWKMNSTPSNLPGNVYVDKWMPQQELLLRPDIKVFLTHAGIGGVNEAIYGAVPLLCFPIFGDQDFNAQLVVNKGIGLTMEITTLTEDVLKTALGELLNNNTWYRNNAVRVRRQFLDRPRSPVQEALWWTEYVLREINTEFRRPLSVNQTWWIRRQVDVWFCVSFIFLAAVYVFASFSWMVTKSMWKAATIVPIKYSKMQKGKETTIGKKRRNKQYTHKKAN